MELSGNWFQSENDLQFTYDLITAIILFFWFNNFKKLEQQAKRKSTIHLPKNTIKITKFIQLKKRLLPFWFLFCSCHLFLLQIGSSLTKSNWDDIATFKISTIFLWRFLYSLNNHWCDLVAVFSFSTLIASIKSFNSGFVFRRYW
jgi:hypothetical protein